MPRPIRIQYESAFYHVMNRGRGCQTIFHDDEYFQAFLQTLAESHSRFDAVIHAYCLMDNHYHLLIETPRANLDRIMRHINGVYTQRYNRLKQTDGPLFRGRYKAILVEEDAYLLQLSRYIHRNPAEVAGSTSEVLNIYPWSSYRAYINLEKSEPWLDRERTYEMLGKRQRYAGYKSYVEAGIDDETKDFYSKGNVGSIFGGKDFREYIVSNEQDLQVSGDLTKVISERPKIDEIVSAVSNVFGVSKESILIKKTGRRQNNFPRKFAMYCCQQYGDISLKEIADYFGLSHIGSISNAIQAVRKSVDKGECLKEMKKVEKVLNVIKQA